jgi:hypothetical protein
MLLSVAVATVARDRDGFVSTLARMAPEAVVANFPVEVGMLLIFVAGRYAEL